MDPAFPTSAVRRQFPPIQAPDEEKLRSLEDFFKNLKTFNEKVSAFTTRYNDILNRNIKGATPERVVASYVYVERISEQIGEIQTELESAENVAKSLEDLQERKKTVEYLKKASAVFKKNVANLAAFSKNFVTALNSSIQKN